jgi:hypothetical protein
MINKENLQIFTYEVLKYKTNVIVDDFEIFNNDLHIIFKGGFGEITTIDKFRKWFLEKRDNKINKIWK